MYIAVSPNMMRQKQLTTYCVLPACNRTHLTVKLPACVPPAIELDEGLFALLLSGHTKQHESYPDAVLTFERAVQQCVGLRFKLNVNISSQVWFMIATDLKGIEQKVEHLIRLT